MMKISLDEHRRLTNTLSGLRERRRPWWLAWRELADFYLPTRYQWLLSPNERSKRATNRNSLILDSTGTFAARTLAAGMMNGLTSPSRPWFKLRIVGFEEDAGTAVRMWLDECETRLLKVFSESNFYQSLSTAYLDLSIFGTSCALIYEHPEKTIHCLNPCLGEFYVMSDAQHRVCGVAREFTYTVLQLVQEFGEENVSETVKNLWRTGGASWQKEFTVIHLIEPNLGRSPVGSQFRYREYYWEQSAPQGEVLRQRGWYDFPAIVPRWELSGNDDYGTSPGMDALGDVIQLQHETKKKAQGIDKLVSPPILADVMLEHRPTALLPNGITYVPRLTDNSGARPIYTVNPPLQEMTADIQDIRQRIQRTFFNDLFNRVLTLETVRSAREIDAIDSERLVLLGSVLHRFENEALDPAIERTFGIMMRNGQLPPPPEELGDAEIKIQYVSIFSAAQNAVTTAPTERLLQIIGSLVGVFPEVRHVPNTTRMLHDYALDIGVKSKDLNPLDEIQRRIAADAQAMEEQRGLDQGSQMVQGAELLSKTDVGGGQNVLQRLLNGG